MTKAVVFFGKAPLSPADKQALLHRLPPAVCGHITAKPAQNRCGSLLAYTALSLLLPEPQQLASVRFPDGGKPHFADLRGEFNLSHTNGAVAAAIADSAVGIDVQALSPPRFSVVRRFFDADEQAALQNAAPAECPRLFTRLWTKKEAAVKQTGRGLSGLNDPIDPRAVFSFAEGDGFVACVCAAEAVEIAAFPVGQLIARALAKKH